MDKKKLKKKNNFVPVSCLTCIIVMYNDEMYFWNITFSSPYSSSYNFLLLQVNDWSNQVQITMTMISLILLDWFTNKNTNTYVYVFENGFHANPFRITRPSWHYIEYFIIMKVVNLQNYSKYSKHYLIKTTLNWK